MAHTMQHTAQDRCDRCRAQGYVTWTNEKGRSLTFCGHHNAAYGVLLIDQGFAIEQDDSRLLTTPHKAQHDTASAV